MPRLEWIGKEKVVNHAKEVPFHVLENKYCYGDGNSGNMVIHGDNLVALKSLLPEYEGKVKCIYIDPPYNTGNEGWVYNDNVNDPRIKKWLGEVVGKEGEDLSRHDKWLCMMYPRLRLLQRFLSKDGAIFISIDDNEEANLKLVCNEIFGSPCFVARITWQNNFSPRNDAKGIPYTTDNILIYSKMPNWQPKRMSRTLEMDARYESSDNDPVPWTSSPAHAPSAKTHKGMVYAIQHPNTGELIYPPAGRCWALEQAKILAIMNEWADYTLKELDDAETRARICNESEIENMPHICGVVLNEPLSSAKEKMLKRYAKGNWPKFYFTSKGKGGIRVKKHLDTMEGKAVATLWQYEDVGTTTEGKNELKKLFNGAVPMDTPKPTRLIERILQIATDKDSIVLDSFAGSGTTAHAVLNLNKKDGGNRKFILIEMMNYAETITAERVKRVISGYGKAKNAVEGTGGGFDFYEIGVPLMKKGLLNENVSPAQIRRYVWYMETHEPPPKEIGANDFVGIFQDTAYYFYYRPGEATVLDGDYLATITTKAESYVIYADRCLLSEDFMERNHIIFKKIPRDIAVL